MTAVTGALQVIVLAAAAGLIVAALLGWLALGDALSRAWEDWRTPAGLPLPRERGR